MPQSDGRADIYSAGVLINAMPAGEHLSRRPAPRHWGRIMEGGAHRAVAVKQWILRINVIMRRIVFCI